MSYYKKFKFFYITNEYKLNKKKMINLKSYEKKENFDNENNNDNALNNEMKDEEKNQIEQNNISNNDLIKPITIHNFLKEKKKPNLNLFKEFTGFFNKKFNLTAYRKERNDSRERSKSPEYKYKPSHKKGNGVPNDLINRLYYLSKIINKEEFIKYYQNRPKGNNFKFEAINDYIMNYKKSHTDLESVLMIYYIICNDIKYYNKDTLEKLKEKYKNKFEYIIFSDTHFFEDDYNLKSQEVFMKGIALNPNYFANVFE